MAANSAQNVIVEVRECAGIERMHEPVMVKGRDLMAVWGEGVNTARIQVLDEQGLCMPVQIDEKDGAFHYAAHANGILDLNDEIVWQVTIPALGVRKFTLRQNSELQPVTVSGELWAGANPEPRSNSASIIARNDHIQFGVRGWPVDESRWGGAGAGSITSLLIDGVEQVFQGESHGWLLNHGNVYNELYDQLEIIAAGPVRVLLQVSGTPFNGRREGFWGRSHVMAQDGRAVRTYMLYRNLPWLAAQESIIGADLHPRLTGVTRYIWRPGGSPFDHKTVLHIAAAPEHEIETFALEGESTYGMKYNGPLQEAWAYAQRPDGRSVPAFFFQPGNVRTLWASLLEPWMKKAWDDSGSDYLRGKCIIDFDWYDPEAREQGNASYSWGVWAVTDENTEQVRRRYQALMLRPLSANIAVKQAQLKKNRKESVLTDALKPPPDAVNVLRRAERRLIKSRKLLLTLGRRHPAMEHELLSQARTLMQQDVEHVRALQRNLTGNWTELSPKIRYETLQGYHERSNAKEPDDLWVQQTDFLNQDGYGKGYRVLVTDNTHKVFRHYRCPGQSGAAVEWQLARREGESVQLGIVPLMTPLQNVEITISDLKGRNGEIPAAGWRRFQVGEVLLTDEKNLAYDKPEGTRWPDPLLPLQAFDCPADEARAVLLTLNVPADARPGRYRGIISVQPEGLQKTDIAVRIEVLNFTLPERRTMNWDSWFDLDTIARHYGEYADFEHYRRNMEFLADYRAVPGLYGWAYMARKFFLVWREPDDTFTFDFSGIDKWLELQQRFGNLWNPNGSCNSGWFSVFHSKNLAGVVHDRETGKALQLADIPARSAVDPEYTLIYERFMQAWVAHLQEKGWLRSGWHEKWDEPVGERVELCQQHHAYLKQIVPELQLFNWGMRPVTDDWGWGYTDAWAPNLHAWHKEMPGIQRARDERLQVFAYTCGAGYVFPDRTIMVPDINIPDANIQRRVYGWLYHKLDLDGLLIFTMNGWPAQTPQAADGSQKWSRDPATRWPRSEWVAGSNNFYLVYPAPDGAIWPSLRLDALRDGLEDYEFLHAAAEYLKLKPDPELEKLLQVDDIISSTEVYSQDPAVYKRRRAALAPYVEAYQNSFIQGKSGN